MGGVAAVAVLSLAFWYFFIRRRYTRQQGIPENNGVPYTSMAQDGHNGIARMGGNCWHEPNDVHGDMGGNSVWQEHNEVPNAEVRRELDSNARQELDARFGGM